MGERNLGFDSLKYMNRDMAEKGIVACNCLPLEHSCPLLVARCLLPAAEALRATKAVHPRQRAARFRWETIAVNNPSLRHVAVQSTSD